MYMLTARGFENANKSSKKSSWGVKNIASPVDGFSLPATLQRLRVLAH
jgi:hypothetical protein